MRSPKDLRSVLHARLKGIGYGPNERALEQLVLENQFSVLGLDYQQAKSHTLNILELSDLHRLDDSLHYELFSAISSVHSPKRVLEIGTFRGEFTAFLTLLFPKAYIETWDLPNNSDPALGRYVTGFAKHYGDQSMTRLDNLKELPDVPQVLKDSTHLILEKGVFDLIWVDGDHTYPLVAFDILNALRLASPSAWIVVDDIKLDSSQGGTLGSTEGFECVRHLSETGLVATSLIFKRIGNSGRHWRNHLRRKHLAVLRPKVGLSHDL